MRLLLRPRIAAALRPPRIPFVALAWLLGLTLQCICPAAESVLHVDFGTVTGTHRPLHGINKGPLAPGGLVDLSPAQNAFAVPATRLHDCGWPNPPVVDIHVVFPHPDADPARAESYDFRLTDEYVAAAAATGSQIVYRLGESIEHTTVRRFVHPPADFQKWAAICVGIIRHYNEGWANGFHFGIKYWEIWNEPENRPAMWSGSDEDYFRLYAVAATAIKREFPHLKIGGPAVGASGRWQDGHLQPTDFVTQFLARCQRDALPLDFFSWHCYTADTTELTGRARAVRQLLDKAGWTATESHLNEWNYLPGNSWAPWSRQSAPLARRQAYAEMAGEAGAAFLVTALLELQDSPLEMANLFHGELGGFGLFDESGVPQKNYGGWLAFSELAAMTQRVSTSGRVPGKLGLGAGRSQNGEEAMILVSNFGDARSEFTVQWSHLPWNGDSLAEVRQVDTTHEFASGRVYHRIQPSTTSLALTLPAPGVAQIRLRPLAPAGAGTDGTLTLVMPPDRLVFQRNRAGSARIPVTGTCAWTDATLETRTRTAGSSNEFSSWKSLGRPEASGSFTEALNLSSGWYDLEIRARRTDGTTTHLPGRRVGVGEVFIVVGHSVAQGGDINLPGASDDRVNTIALPTDASDRQRLYERTGDAQFLPAPVGHQFGTGIVPAPFGHGTYFWAQFGEQITQAQNVPVLLLNAAFGGTTLEYWAKSARGESFEHSFVKSDLRMPYRNLRLALQRYVSLTGVRAILADHGQNDRLDPDEDRILNHYRTWIEQARRDLGFPELAIVINRQTPPDAKHHVRRVQDRMIREVSACFPGPDYDLLEPSDRTDGIHLSAAGAQKAASLWATALNAHFFQTSVPFQPPSP